MEEIFEIVNEDGTVIGHALRSECHGNPALLHRTVHVLVINEQGDVWLQKRSAQKDIQPGKWDTSVGGHVAVGETILDAVGRETQEEIGIETTDFEPCFTYTIRNDIESELTATFRHFVKNDTIINFNPDEISEGRFWSAGEIADKLGKQVFTPNFEQEWQRYTLWKQEHDKM